MAMSRAMPRSGCRVVAAIVAAAAMGLLTVACQGHDKPTSRRALCGFPSGRIAELGDPTEVWSHATPEIGFYSPRGTDLDGDGTIEIVVSGGREVNPTGTTIALDGATGQVAWEVPARQEMYNSATFLDVNGDGVKDVFVGGRNKEFMGIDGATGAVLWLFPHAGLDADDPWLNFYIPVVIEDRTGDGVPDLLLATGGADYIHEDGAPRPPGALLIVDAVRGVVIAFGTTPDSEEIYMSPLVIPGRGGGPAMVLFGTGGETRGGALWKVPLDDIPPGPGNRDFGSTELVTARRLVDRGMRKGVIAPPALADLNGDGQRDIVVAAFDGRLIALDGATDATLWERIYQGAETFSTPTLGFFDDDAVPDVFAVFLRGVFPQYTAVTRTMLSGANGSVLWEQDAGNLVMSGDLAVDLNGDGVDEIIFSSNDVDAPAASQQRLFLLDPVARQARAWGAPLGAVAVGSPWLGDVDGDGCLDMVVAHASRTDNTASAVISRFKVPTAVPAAISWAGYLGTRFDSNLYNSR